MNGTAGAIPEVTFDIGESYAGLMPISSASNETGELYFWFFPSENEQAGDEITIWLNGVSSSMSIGQAALTLRRDQDAPLSKVFCKRTDRSHGSTAHRNLCTTRGTGLRLPTWCGWNSPSAPASRKASRRRRAARRRRSSLRASGRTSSRPLAWRIGRCTLLESRTQGSTSRTLRTPFCRRMIRRTMM